MCVVVSPIPITLLFNKWVLTQTSASHNSLVSGSVPLLSCRAPCFYREVGWISLSVFACRSQLLLVQVLFPGGRSGLGVITVSGLVLLVGDGAVNNTERQVCLQTANTSPASTTPSTSRSREWLDANLTPSEGSVCELVWILKMFERLGSQG